MICLWCNEKIILQTNWTTVFYPNNHSKLCHECQKKLRLLQGKKCEICSRESDVTICQDCQWWKTYFISNEDPLTKNVSIYTYNTFMKELIANWKYRGDYILGEMFAQLFQEKFHKHFKVLEKHALIVPIPLSNERRLERGFNQAKMLADFLTGEVTEILERTHNEKQSKKTRRERMSANNPFKLQIPINKPVILVDDIYTTGRTIRHAAQLLKENGCPKVYSYTLIRG